MKTYVNWKDLVVYDETSSTYLRWNVKPSPRVRIGDEVGSINSRGYMKTSYKGCMESLHRVVWEIHHGKIPDDLVVDHIDRVKTNNNISNLRLVTRSQNNFNTNHKRYYFNKASKKWRVFITIEGKQIYCGSFDSEELAKKESIRLQQEFYGEFYHGQV